ncbi:DUF1905 domain-containing protein [Nocardioides sp.]|uniref:DUF1905 domain-containing protein n=1 Tax=Nocardioides sp. TaxID=35761 RepID=UPI003528E638
MTTRTRTNPRTPGPLDLTFEAELVRSDADGGWTYVVWPDSVAVFGTRGLVRVTGTVDGVAIRTSFMALGDGRHKLPVRADVLQQTGRVVGDTVTVHLTERR